MAQRATAQNNLDVVVSARKTLFRGLLYAGILSAFITLLQMLVPLYMLQVYDRVLNSRSVDTLMMLSILVVAGLTLYAILEFLRSRTMLTLGAQFLRKFNLPLVEASVRASLQEGSVKASQSLRDLSEIRNFFASGAAPAPLEAIWSPIFMVTLFLLHPVYGLIAFLSALVVIALSLVGDLITGNVLRDANTGQVEVVGAVGSSLRHAEAIDAMGMLPHLGKRWQAAQNTNDRLFEIGMQRNKFIAAVSKAIRYAMQAATLGFGALLAIDHQITPGVMIAASILMARTLQPFDSMIDNWRSWRAATAAWGRIQTVLTSDGAQREMVGMPRPEGELAIERLSYVAPGTGVPILKGLQFTLQPGEVLGVLGASASGKSTLARLLVGVLKPSAGGVFLGGHNVHTWERGSFGRAVGYLPQSVSLLDGTILENIARLDDSDPAGAIAAARMAGVHEMIGRLPLGYDTPTGDSRLTLSGGQKQRVGLARAVYGRPRLVVLDEPNANLDAEGEQSLYRTIEQLKADGSIVIIIAHRAAVLQVADKLLVLQKDQSWQLGPASSISAMIGGGNEPMVVNG
jgi:ATP-binding cassette subfamily C protein